MGLIEVPSVVLLRGDVVIMTPSALILVPLIFGWTTADNGVVYMKERFRFELHRVLLEDHELADEVSWVASRLAKSMPIAFNALLRLSDLDFPLLTFRFEISIPRGVSLMILKEDEARDRKRDAFFPLAFSAIKSGISIPNLVKSFSERFLKNNMENMTSHVQFTAVTSHVTTRIPVADVPANKYNPLYNVITDVANPDVSNMFNILLSYGRAYTWQTKKPIMIPSEPRIWICLPAEVNATVEATMRAFRTMM